MTSKGGKVLPWQAADAALRHLACAQSMAVVSRWWPPISRGQGHVVRFDRRSHNPVLRQAVLGQDRVPIPWLGNLTIRFTFA